MVCHELDCKAFNKKNALGRKQEMVYIYTHWLSLVTKRLLLPELSSDLRWKYVSNDIFVVRN